MDIRKLPLKIEILKGFLSEDEKMKADRLRIVKQKQQNIVAQAFLRCLLSHYVHTKPDEIKLVQDKYGKPHLNTDNNQNRVNFNLSHSYDLIAAAMCYDNNIGIDIEKIRSDRSFLRIAKRFFSTDEYADLCSLNSDARQHAFYRCWTRKEAYLKAIGKGIRLPINNFSVSISLDQSASVLRINNAQGETSKWNLIDIETLSDYQATVAIKSHNHTIIQKQLAFRFDCFP